MKKAFYISFLGVKMSFEVEVKILDSRLTEESAFVYGSDGSAGLDLRACINEPLTLGPNEWKLVPSGLAVFLDESKYAGLILPRSGMGHKNGIVLGNLVGLIDSDYQGQLQMSLWNRTDQAFTIQPMERVAQYVVVPVVRPKFKVVQHFRTETERGEGGFNSTGTK